MEICLCLVLNKKQRERKHDEISTLADSSGILLAPCFDRSVTLSDRVASFDSIPAYRYHCGCCFSVIQSRHNPPGQNTARSEEVISSKNL